MVAEFDRQTFMDSADNYNDEVSRSARVHDEVNGNERSRNPKHVEFWDQEHG